MSDLIYSADEYTHALERALQVMQPPLDVITDILRIISDFVTYGKRIEVNERAGPMTMRIALSLQYASTRAAASRASWSLTTARRQRESRTVEASSVHRQATPKVKALFVPYLVVDSSEPAP